MTDPQAKSGVKAAALKIPAGTQEQFADLIDLIEKSQSMDHEEQQYWVNALPVMTAEQVENLRDILHKEQEQLSAAKTKNQKNLSAIEKKYRLQFDSFEYKKKKELLKEKEKAHRAAEEEGLSGILEEIENIEKKT